MTIQQILDLALKMGVDSDLRGKAKVNQNLKRLKDKYEKLRPEQKKEFDKDRLTNPYPDSRLHYGDPGKKIKKVLVGVDIEGEELNLAKNLGADLVISHHPVGKGLADLSAVMHMQAEILHLYGVPINVAQRVLKERIQAVARGVLAVNHYRPVDHARLVKMPLINVHTPADNLAAKHLFDVVKKKKPELVGDIVKMLKEIPEYEEAIKLGTGPKLFSGTMENYCGKVAVTELTGGTEGAKDIYQAMANAGIGTVISMHQSEEHREEAQKAHVNVVIAGHLSSDSLGMNLFLDELEKKGVEVVACSGLIRVSRAKKRKK